MGCFIPSSYIQNISGKLWDALFMALSYIYQWETLWDALFLALTVHSVGNCGMHYSKLLLTVYQWETLWDAVFKALTYSSSVGNSMRCIIPSSYSTFSGKLWDALF